MNMLLSFALLLYNLSTQHTTGRITGKVVDQTGHPVGGVSVDIVDQRGSFAHPVLPAVTNEAGEFVTSDLIYGRYRLFPWKVSAGVPDPAFDIFQSPDTEYQSIDLNEGSRDKAVTLTLPNAFGRIVIDVTDATTKNVVSNARITVRVAEKPSVFVSKGCGEKGHVELLLPRRSLLVTITAPGYKDANVADPNSRFLILAPNETRQYPLLLAR